MIRITLVALISLLSLLDATAQVYNNPSGARFAMYADAGTIGTGSVFTINTEARVWTNNKAIQLFARSGYGYAINGTMETVDEFYGAPLNITVLFGRRMHYFEVTAGGIFAYKKITRQDVVYDGFGIWPLFDIGYRFQYQPKGVIFRAKIGTGGIGGGIGVGF